MLKMLFNFKNKDRQERFLESIEGLGDILVSETQKKRRGQVVRKALNDLTDIIIKLFELQKTSPQEFEKLILDKEFFNIHKKNKREAALRLELQPDKYLVAFSSPLNQILRVHDVALKEDDEISRAVVNSLIRVLKYVSTTKKNELFVKQLLRKILEAFHKAIKKDDPSLFTAAFEWYPEIVFDIYEGGRKTATFNLEYLSLFDPFFISVCKFLIGKDHFEVFRQLIFSFIDGVHIPTYNQGKIWDFESILMRGNFKKYKEFDSRDSLHYKISNLDKVNIINSTEKLNESINKLDEIKNLSLKYKPTRKEKSEIEQLYLAYRNYLVSMYKYNNLIRIFFGIGAYCWFKKRLNFIKLIWEAKQPPDSDASWGGENIVPDSIQEILEFYFSNSDIRYSFDFWEGHSGSEKYLNEYFLLLLAKYLIPIQASPQDYKYYWNTVYSLPKKYTPNELSSISHISKKLAEQAENFKPESNTFEELGLPGNETDVMKNKVSPFLMSISSQAESQLESSVAETNISNNKVKKFREEFMESYNNNAVFRSLFKSFSLVKQDKTTKNKVISLGYNRIEDKEVFIEDWHIHYPEWGKQYGSGLASAEDTEISEAIIKKAKKLENSLDSFLRSSLTNGSVVILAPRSSVFNFSHQNTFTPKYQVKEPLELVGFAGYWKIADSNVPVIEYSSQNKEPEKDSVIVVDMKRLGSIIQLPPLEKLDKGLQKRITPEGLFFEITSFSESEDLINKFIKTPPDWLKEKGGVQQQTSFLKKKVLIKIQERFSVELQSKPEIYKFDISK